MNLRDAMLRKEINFVQKAADEKDGRLATKNNLLIGVWMSGSFIDLKWGDMRNQGTKAPNLANIF